MGSALSGQARRWAPPAVAAVGLLSYAWLATALQPFTWPQRVMTGAAGTAVLVLAAYWSGRRLSLSRWWAVWHVRLLRDYNGPSPPDGRLLRWRAGAFVWGSLITAIMAWELAMLFSHPRSAHPTLSALIDLVLRDHFIRFLAFVVWMALGLELARR